MTKILLAAVGGAGVATLLIRRIQLDLARERSLFSPVSFLSVVELHGLIRKPDVSPSRLQQARAELTMRLGYSPRD